MSLTSMVSLALRDALSECLLFPHTVTESEPNKASLWKINLQKRENSHVDTGTFLPPLTRFLYILLCRKSVLVSRLGHFMGLRR